MSDLLKQAQDLLKMCQENPTQAQELAKTQSGTADPKSLIKSELNQTFTPKFYTTEKAEALNKAAKMAKQYGGLAASESKKVSKDGNLNMAEKGSKSKHDRCVEHVEHNSPGVKNPHAVCVAEGVRPASWKKNEDSYNSVMKEEFSPRFNKAAYDASKGKPKIVANNVIKPSDVKDMGHSDFMVSHKAAMQRPAPVPTKNPPTPTAAAPKAASKPGAFTRAWFTGRKKK
ncbi:MAG: hypothetical protein ACREGB_03365 [Candidatus Saccharimonadales bacterium]